MAWKPDGWLLGVPLLVLIWAGQTRLAAPHLEAQLKANVQERLDATGLRRSGARIEVHGRDVAIVTDFPQPPDVQASAEQTLRAIPGLRQLRFGAAKPAPMQPFRLTIRRESGRLVLRGGIPAGEVHGLLLEQSAALVGAAQVDDKLVPALAPPPAFAEAAGIVLKLAGSLTRGQASLSDRLIGVQGETADFDAYNAIQSALLALPPGYALGPVDVVPPEAKPFRWAVRRDGDGVLLEGDVPSEAARRSLRDLVTTLIPDASIRDEMQTARGLGPSVDFASLSRAGLDAVAPLKQGRAAYENGRLSLAGTAPARDLIAALPERLRHELPSGVQPGAISVAPVPASPFVFSAVRNGGRVSLAGFTPDQTAQDTVRQLARDTFPGEAISDDLHLADGAPDGFGRAVVTGLDALSALASGTLTISGQRAELRGRALYPELAERTRQKLAKALPEGWATDVEIQADPIEKPLDPGLCEDLIADALGRDPLRFEPSRAELSPKSQTALDSLADILRRCGRAGIRVVVRPEVTDDPAAAQKLAEVRAGALASALTARVGASGARISVVAEGPPAKPESERLAVAVSP